MRVSTALLARPGYRAIKLHKPASARARADMAQTSEMILIKCTSDQIFAVARWRGLGCLPAIPRARGLALGYMLSPAGAGLGACPRYPGLADSPWLHAVARWRGLGCLPAIPRARGLALGYMLSPAGAGLGAITR